MFKLKFLSWRQVAWILLPFILAGAMLYFYYVYPSSGIGPQQPVYFSHRVHAQDKKISCRFCHPFVDRSPNPGLPPVGLCFFCHQSIIPQHPEIEKERWYYNTMTPVPWVKIFYLPDHVKFNHQPHFRAKVDCIACHGDVKKHDRLSQVELKMAFCVDCHKQNKAELDCWLSCHH